MAHQNGAFPELTIELGTSPSRAPAPLSPIGQVVENTLREVLAWRPKTSDPKGFVAALGQAFTITEVDGHTEFAWTPRSYAVQADMGAVTGAQASIYARAKAALDHSLPLLEGLLSLSKDDDDEDDEAIRALVRSQLVELVAELGVVGGPRLQRVDAYFDALLGAEFIQGDKRDPEKAGGLLGVLRERFELQRAAVNTIDEEQNLTNYLILVDHVITLHHSWSTYQHFFDRQNGDVFLGTQLVQISRAMGVVAESVQELYFIMDSVFLGAAERQTILLPFANGEHYLTIDELLTWVERFAAEEGPQVIRDAGKDGVIALAPTTLRLQQLVKAARAIAQSDSDNPTGGFHTDRVRQGWKELDLHVTNLTTQIGRIRRLPAPTVTAINPNRAFVGDRVRMTVNGANFQNDARVKLQQNWTSVVGAEITVVSPTELNVTFDLTGQPTGSWLVMVTNSRDDASNTPDQGPTFTLEARQLPATDPKVIGLNPNAAFPGESLDVTIFGMNLQDVVSSAFGADISVTMIKPEDANRLRTAITVAQNAAPGLRDVTVTDAKGITDTLLNSFIIKAPPPPPPNLRAVVEPAGTQGEKMTVKLVGTDFQCGAQSDFGPGITVQTTAYVSAIELLAVIAIADDATPGSRNVAVTHLDTQQTTTLTGSFTVLAEDNEPITVEEIEFLNSDGKAVRKWTSKQSEQRLQVSVSEQIAAIRVTFSAVVDQRSITTADHEHDFLEPSFLVVYEMHEATVTVPGALTDEDEPDTVLFTPTTEQFQFCLPVGAYHMTLFGKQTPGQNGIIIDEEGQPLDGDGDGDSGDNFDFTLIIADDDQTR